jgi:hypothetical protein
MGHSLGVVVVGIVSGFRYLQFHRSTLGTVPTLQRPSSTVLQSIASFDTLALCSVDYPVTDSFHQATSSKQRRPIAYLLLLLKTRVGVAMGIGKS